MGMFTSAWILTYITRLNIVSVKLGNSIVLEEIVQTINS